MGHKHIGIALFAAIWLVVLIVPTLRLMLRVQWEGHNASTARYSNDVRVLAKSAEAEGGGPTKETVQKYDRLIQRFPNEAWLIANRLRFTAFSFSDDRVAGDFEKLPESAPREKKNFTPAELAQAIAVAEKGQRLEPDNFFFDWMVAYFLFAGGRDKEALVALHKGAQKPRYDDHTLYDLQVSVAVRELVRPLLAEEKIALSAAVLFSHLTKQRHVARLAVWEGVKAERAGDHPRALQIYSDIARLGARIRENSQWIIEGLVAEAIELIAWGGVERKISREERARLHKMSHYRAERARMQSERFARYAVTHGRVALAEEARRDGEILARFLEQTDRAFKSDEVHEVYEVYNVPNPTLMTILSLWWASAVLLPQLLLNALLWFILSFLLWRKEVHGGTIRRLDSASSVLACGAAPILLGVAALVDGVWWNEMVKLLGAFNFYVYPQESIPNLLLHLICLLIAVTPALLGAAYCAAAIMWRHRRTLQAAQMLSKKDILQAGSLRYPSLPWWERDLAPLLHLIGTWALHFLTIAAWVNLVIALISEEQQNYALPLLLSFLCVLRWVLKWLYFTPVSLRPITGYGLRWYRQTLGAFLLLSSLGYLVLSLASLPLRRDADTKMDDIIRRGELAVLLERERQQPKK
jgi:hypothetical protein